MFQNLILASGCMEIQQQHFNSNFRHLVNYGGILEEEKDTKQYSFAL